MPFDPTNATAIVIGGINCWDEVAREILSIRGTSNATRILVCRWNDRFTLATALLGGQLAPGIVSAGLSYPDAQWMGATDIETDGVDGENGAQRGPNGMRAYDYCRMTITYNPPTAAPLGGGYDPDLTELDFSTQILSRPRDRATFKFSSTGLELPAEATPPLVDSTVDFRVPMSGLSQIPTAMMQDFINKVNNATFFGGVRSSILFLGPSNTKQRFITNEMILWDTVLNFSYRKIGWNNFINPVTGLPDAVVDIVTGDPPYEEADLSQLLQLT
jgi:hypothetical protein